MKPKTTGIFSQHGFANDASKLLIALTFFFLVSPCLLPAQSLLHRYSFVSDASDSIGTANGTVVAPNGGSPVTIANGLSLPGGGGPGFSGYVSLPAGILTNTASVTIEGWVTQTSGNTWAQIWNFGNGQSQNTGLIPLPGRDNGNFEAGINPNNDEVDIVSQIQFPNNSQQYVALVFNSSTLQGALYDNGILLATHTFPNATYIPGSIGGANGTANNVLGQDPYPDPQFQGMINELRIWNGAVSQRYLSASAVAGPGVVINNLTPTSVSITAGPGVIITGTEQAIVTVTLTQTGSTPLPATSDATNWISSNPSVLAVNSSGLVTGVGVGSATVSAKVAGVMATSGTITVTGPQTLLHRYSFVSDATDSVGGANGTLVPASNVNGTNATIANGLFLPGGGGGAPAAFSGYLSLPGGMLTNTTSVTVECWVTQNNANTWGTPWAFANNGSQNFALIPHPGNNGGNMQVAFTPNGGEIDLASAVSLLNGSEQYVAMTYNNYTLTGNLYTNGALIATQTFPNTGYCPGGIGGAGGTSQNWLGADTYGDTQFQGTIYEFRIWNGAVSPAYLAASAVAGPGVIVTNLIPTSLNVSLATTSMIGSGTQQATVTGNFLQASGAILTGAVTNWVSSNPSIITVNGTGLITAVNGGSATVSATVNGVTATSAAVTVATTPPTFTQKPANLTAVVGDTVIFNAQALGGSLSYQWSNSIKGVISGATNPTLTLTNVALTDAGTYSVFVKNSQGSTNASATLAVVSSVLLHRYSFASDASDSIGTANGTIVAPNGGSVATIANGLSLPGGGGPGFSGYVSLPAGILTNTTSLTVECWATQNSQDTWAELWNFNNGTAQYIGFIPFPQNNNNNMSAAFRNGTEYDAFSGVQFPNGSEQYVVTTFNAATLVGSLYTNGTLIASVTTPNNTYIPGTFGGAGGTLNNYLGQDPFPDPQFQGTIYEFRIWDGVVSPLYLAVSAIAGPSVVVTNTTPQSLSVSANTSMLPGQTQQAVATGNFLQASSVPVTGFATNWTSSNTGILMVNGSGVITAVNTGSATVSATVNGVTGTSASISVPTSLPVITQEPVASENLLAGATLSASVGNIGTPPFTYRWYFNNGANPISTAATPALIIPSLQPGNAGSYTCVVSNQYGTALSSALSLTIVPPTVYQQALLQFDPIAYWPLTETTGMIAYDTIGGYNGTYTGSYTLAQSGPASSIFGSPSYSAAFDGTSAYVDIPEGPFNITNAVTTVAWVDLLAVPGFGGVIGHGDASYRMSVNSSSQPGAADGNAPGDVDATSLASIFGDWHMVAYTYSGAPGHSNNGQLYVDGVPVANNTVSLTPTGNNLDVWIGGSPDYGTARLLPAQIAHAAIFNRALTAAQVQGLYNGVFVPGPETIGITHAGSNVVLTWQTGALLQAPTLLGPWTTNTAAVSPYTVPTTAGNQFFKVLIGQ